MAAKKIQELSKFVDSGNLKNLNELEKKMGPLTSKCLDLNDKEQVLNCALHRQERLCSNPCGAR